MRRALTNDRTTSHPLTRNLPLAIILAAGLAAGLALARPAAQPTDPGTVDPASTATRPDVDPTGSYRQGNRPAGDRTGTGGTPSPNPTAAGAAIAIEGFAFTGPSTAAPGSALAVTNRDGVAHTLSFRSAETDTGTIDGGATATVTAPTAPGTYAFFCRIHPSMEGEIEITG